MSRNISVDLFKIVMSLLVVLIHYPPPLDSFFLSYILNDISRIAVPAFFMLSGFYLTKISQKKTINTWLSKLIVVYLAWEFIYFLYMYYPKGDTGGAYYVINNIIEGWFHLWYFPAIIMATIIANILKDLKTRTILLFSLILFFILFYLQIGKSDFINLYAYRNFLFLGLPCVLVGVLLYRHSDLLTVRNLIYASIMLVPIIVVWYYFSYEKNKLILEVPLTSLMMAILLVSAITKINIYSSINIGKLSTVIYLIHPIFIDISKLFTSSFLIVYFGVITMSVIFLIIAKTIKLKYII